MTNQIPLPIFRRIVRIGGLYDLVVTLPFATPWTFTANWRLLSGINQSLGGAPLPSFASFPMLLANLMGSLVVVWSWLRLRHGHPLFGRYDGTARFLFSTWMAWGLLVTGQPFLWLFLVPEIAWGVVQWWPLAEMPVLGPV